MLALYYMGAVLGVVIYTFGFFVGWRLHAYVQSARSDPPPS